MNVARVLFPVRVLGPGRRIGLCIAGCPRRCAGCSNPELWEAQPSQAISVQKLVAMLAPIWQTGGADGFTLTGGDPLAQAHEMRSLLHALTHWTRDILIYTGYTLEELLSAGNDDVLACLAQTGVLIDGPYREAENRDVRLRGSANQRIFCFSPELSDRYRSYLANGRNEIQNFMTQDGMVSVGIHRPALPEELAAAAHRKGVLFS